MSSVLLRDFVFHLAICSERAACIARYIRFMHSDFNSIIQEKQRNDLLDYRLVFLYCESILFFLLVDENHQHLDADYKTLA